MTGAPTASVAAASSCATMYPTGPTGCSASPQRTTAASIASMPRYAAWQYQDGPAEGDVGAFGAVAAGDSPVLLSQVGLGLCGARGGVAEHGGQIGVPVAGGALAVSS